MEGEAVDDLPQEGEHVPQEGDEGGEGDPSFEQHEDEIEMDGILDETTPNIIPYRDIDIGRIVGEGAYGVVMKGKYFGAKVHYLNAAPSSPQENLIQSLSFFKLICFFQ